MGWARRKVEAVQWRSGGRKELVVESRPRQRPSLPRSRSRSHLALLNLPLECPPCLCLCLCALPQAPSPNLQFISHLLRSLLRPLPIEFH